MNRMKVLIIILILACLLSSCSKEGKNVVELIGNPQVPKEASVIFHFATRINPRTASLDKMMNEGYSQVHYFNENGDEINSFHINKEIMFDFIVQEKDEIIYFFNNFTILANNDTYLMKEKESDIEINRTLFGPYKVGCIRSKDISYSFLNVGGASTDSYNTILRLVSNTENYDIIIPYYVSSIAYDEVKDRFVCVIAAENIGTSSEKFQYNLISFDTKDGKYKRDETLYSIDYTHELYNDDSIAFDYIYARGDIIYQISAVDSLDDIIKRTNETIDSEPFISENAVLLLTKIDLIKKEIEYIPLTDTYKRNELGHPLLSGSADMPMSEHNGKIYVFTSDFKLYIIEDENKIVVREFTFDFKDMVSKRDPYKNSKYELNDDFFDSIVSVEDDGNIYVANLYEDGKLRIHKLNADDTFELFWESSKPMPELDKGNMQINTFEIIN